MSPDLILVNLAVGVVLPLLVQLLAKAKAPASVKSLISLLLSGAAGVLTPLLTLDSIHWIPVGISIGQIFVVTIASHFGLLKPLNLTGSNGAIANAVPGGVGSEVPDAPAVVTNNVTAGSTYAPMPPAPATPVDAPADPAVPSGGVAPPV